MVNISVPIFAAAYMIHTLSRELQRVHLLRYGSISVNIHDGGGAKLRTDGLQLHGFDHFVNNTEVQHADLLTARATLSC